MCPTCGQCSSCCKNSACRVQASKVLANLAGSRGRSENSSNLERGLHPSFPDPANSYKVSYCRKPLCQSPQEQLPVGGITSAYRQKCSGTGPQSNISGFLQWTISSPKAQQEMETNTGPKQLKLFLKVEKFKMETPETSRTSLQQGEWVTSVDFKDAYFHIPIQEQSRKYLRFLVQGRTYQFKSLPFGLSTAPMEFTVLAKEVKLMAIHRGIRAHQYLDDWLVRATSQHICLQHTQILVQMLAGEVREIRTGTQTSIRLCRLPVRPQVRPGQTDSGPVAKPSGQDTSTFITTGLSGPAVHVLDRSSNSHRKAGSPRPTTHETHTVASQKQLEGTRISREGYPSTKVPAPSLTMGARGRQCTSRPTITPSKTCSANFYASKRGVGRSLKRVHCKRVLVGPGKQAAHKLSGTKSSVPSLKRVSKSLCRQNSSGSSRQYYSSSLHKQGRRNEVGPTVENLDLVFPATSDSKSSTHPRPFKCDSRQATQAGSDHPNRVVPPSGSFSTNMQPMAPASNRSICHEVQPQVTSVCLSSTGLPGCSSGRTYSAMVGSGCICLPTDRHIGQSGGEATGLPMQKDHYDCPGVAQHALVLGLGDHVQSGPSQPADTALQSDPSQKSDKSKSPCLAPGATKKNRASLRQWPQELRLLKEDLPDQSVRQSGPF